MTFKTGFYRLQRFHILQIYETDTLKHLQLDHTHWCGMDSGTSRGKNASELQERIITSGLCVVWS